MPTVSRKRRPCHEIQLVLQHRNDGKRPPHLSKQLGRCRQRTAMSKRASYSEDPFAAAVMKGKFIVGHKKFLQLLNVLRQSGSIFYWIHGSTAICSASSNCQQEKFLEEEIFLSWCLITKITKISQCTVWPNEK